MLQYVMRKYAQFRGEEGVTAIEYGLLAALIAIAIIGGATLLGDNIDQAFSDVADKVTVPGS